MIIQKINKQTICYDFWKIFIKTYVGFLVANRGISDYQNVIGKIIPIREGLMATDGEYTRDLHSSTTCTRAVRKPSTNREF